MSSSVQCHVRLNSNSLIEMQADNSIRKTVRYGFNIDLQLTVHKGRSFEQNKAINVL